MLRKKRRSKILMYLFLIIAIFIVLEFLLLFSGRKKAEEKEVKILTNASIVKMKIPAVDAEGKGVSTVLSVEAIKTDIGGRTLVDIENLLFWADTQHSIRIARLVADKFTNNSVKNYNLIYNIEANASIIGGPSAGAAITIATIFALNNQQLRQDIMITGTINHDGSIGPVSIILEKAKASKEAGASIFLVPLLQSRDVVYETKEYCEKFGFTEICTQETIPKKIDVSKEAGISVIEVSNVDEALKYF